jgi:hypothetical protein
MLFCNPGYMLTGLYGEHVGTSIVFLQGRCQQVIGIKITQNGAYTAVMSPLTTRTTESVGTATLPENLQDSALCSDGFAITTIRHREVDNTPNPAGPLAQLGISCTKILATATENVASVVGIPGASPAGTTVVAPASVSCLPGPPPDTVPKLATGLSGNLRGVTTTIEKLVMHCN